jgi:hypothetical protein
LNVHHALLPKYASPLSPVALTSGAPKLSLMTVGVGVADATLI